MTGCKNTEEGISYQFYNSFAALPDNWDVLLPAGHFLRKANLAATEESQLPDLSYVYALAIQNNKPVAAAYFQLLKLQTAHLNVQMLPPIQKYAWKGFIGIMRPTLLVAGHLFRHDIEAFYYTADIAPFEAFRIYNNAINTLLQTSCAYAVLVKDMPGQLITYFQHYAPKYILLRNDILMEMEIPENWHSIYDYEKALKHKYAQRFRKIKTTANNIAVKELDVIATEEHKQILYKLYKQVCEKQAARIGMISPDFIPLLKKQHPDTFKVWAVYEGDTIVAFFTAWIKEQALDMFYIGFDYARNADLQLYFNILFFGLEQAIQYKKAAINFGRTALDAKARLGCTPKYQSTFVLVRNRYIRMATLRLQQNSQSQEGEWEQRHPFKK